MSFLLFSILPLSTISTFGAAITNYLLYKKNNEKWRVKLACFFLFLTFVIFIDFLTLMYSNLYKIEWDIIIITFFILYVIFGFLAFKQILHLANFSLVIVLNKKRVKLLLSLITISIIIAVIVILNSHNSTLFFSLVMSLVSLIVLVFLFKRKDKSNIPKDLMFFLYLIFSIIPLEFVEYSIKYISSNRYPFPVGIYLTPVSILILCLFSIKSSLKLLAPNQYKDIDVRKELYKLYNLTPREIDVALILSEGKQNKEIAAMLFISKRTVDRHVENIYKKTKANSKAQFISLFFSKFK